MTPPPQRERPSAAALGTIPGSRRASGCSARRELTKSWSRARELLRRWIGQLGPLLIADLDRALVTALGINTVPYREEGRRDERARLKALHGAGGVAALRADRDPTAGISSPGDPVSTASYDFVLDGAILDGRPPFGLPTHLWGARRAIS